MNKEWFGEHSQQIHDHDILPSLCSFYSIIPCQVLSHVSTTLLIAIHITCPKLQTVTIACFQGSGLRNLHGVRIVPAVCAVVCWSSAVIIVPEKVVVVLGIVIHVKSEVARRVEIPIPIISGINITVFK